MLKEDRKLLTLIEESKNGSVESYKKFIASINEELIPLISFVYSNKDTVDKLNKYIVAKMQKSLSEFNPHMEDVHLWIARFTTMSIYEVYCKQNSTSLGSAKEGEYEWESIEQDDVLADCASKCNQAFVDKEVFEIVTKELKSLTKLERLLYQMYCYESYTVDEIEEALQIDSAYIAGAIVTMREKVIDYGIRAGIVKQSNPKSDCEAKDDINNRAQVTKKSTSDTNHSKGRKVSKKDLEERFIFAYIPDKILSISIIAIVVLIVILSMVVVLNIGKTGKSEQNKSSVYETMPGATFVNPDKTNNSGNSTTAGLVPQTSGKQDNETSAGDESSSPEETTPEQDGSEDGQGETSTPEDNTEDTTPEETTPEETTPEETTPSSDEPSSNPDESPSTEGTTPDETMPEESSTQGETEPSSEDGSSSAVN